MLAIRSDPAPPPYAYGTKTRLAPGLPYDAETMHAAFGHVSDATLAATSKAYGMLPLAPFVKCNTCILSNMTRAPTHRVSKSTKERPLRRTWVADLIGPISPESRHHSAYLLHLQEKSTKYEYVAGLRDHRGETVRAALRVWHALFTARSLRPALLITDGGGEFKGGESQELYAELSMAYELRTRDNHAEHIEPAHRRLYESIRPALREAR